MTKAQQRARERKRYERRVQNAQERELARQRRRRIGALAAAGLTVAGGALILGRQLAEPADKGTAAAKGTTTTTLLPGCTEPPAAQTTPRTFGGVPDKSAAAGKVFTAAVTTNCGQIDLELDGRVAPQTVASFLHLAAEGYWAPSPCHRLTTSGIFVLQCGDPTGTGQGGPGYGYGIENAPPSGTYPTGTLAMARTSDPNSNGGQFFVVYKDTNLPTEGGGYSIFGKVVAGMDIVDKIAAAGATEPSATGNTAPKAPLSILSVAVTEKKA